MIRWDGPRKNGPVLKMPLASAEKRMFRLVLLLLNVFEV